MKTSTHALFGTVLLACLCACEPQASAVEDPLRVNDAICGSGTLPADTLVLLLWRIGRPTEALHAALERPNDASMASSMPVACMLPSLVELAAIGPDWEMLRAACRARGDEITFAVTLAIEHANG